MSNADRIIDGFISAIAHGDHKAFEALVDEAGPFVLNLCRRYERRQDDAEDLCQIVFTTVWRRAEGFDPARGTGWAWLAVMTRSAAYDRRRRETRHQRRVDALADEGRVEQQLSERSAVDRRLITLDVRDALEKLPGDQRKAIELAFYGGLTYAEVADHLQQPEGTVKSRIRRGMHRLAAELEEVER